MNLKIAICDDEKEQRDFLESLIKKWADACNIKANVLGFCSAESFLIHYASDSSFDIVVLDVMMGNMNGMELARKIRQENSELQIIFITGFPDFMPEGFDVNALHYLLKPVDPQKLNQVLDKALKAFSRTEKPLVFSEGGEAFRVFATDIVYIESFSHSVEIVTKSKTIKLKMPLYEISRALGEAFFSPHRSYLVNMKYVAKIAKTDVILDDGKAIPLSRRSYNAANKAFIKYYKGGAIES